MDNREYKTLIDWIPARAFFTLQECADLKGINYKTMQNKPHLKPSQGKNFKWVGGRKVFDRQSVIDWLFLDDKEMLSYHN